VVNIPTKNVKNIKTFFFIRHIYLIYLLKYNIYVNFGFWIICIILIIIKKKKKKKKKNNNLKLKI